MRRGPANPTSPNLSQPPCGKRRSPAARVAIMAVASIAFLVPAITDASAQFGINIGGFGIGGGGGGFGGGGGYGRGGYSRGQGGGNAMRAGRTPGGRGMHSGRSMGNSAASTGGYGCRGRGCGGYPTGSYPRGPRGPGGIVVGVPPMMPPYAGPRGPVVVDDDDDLPPRRTIHRAEKPHHAEKSQRAEKKSTKASRRQEAQQRRQPPSSRRIATGVPPRGESRFVPDQVICVLRGNLSERQIDRFIRDNRLARTNGGVQQIALLNARVFRYRIVDGRAVSTVIAALERDNRVISAQPNYLYTLAQAQESVAAQAPAVDAIAKSAAAAAAAVLSASPAAKPSEPATTSDASSAASSSETAPAAPDAVAAEPSVPAPAAVADAPAVAPATSQPAPDQSASTSDKPAAETASAATVPVAPPAEAPTPTLTPTPAVAPVVAPASSQDTNAGTAARPENVAVAPRLPADPMQYTIAKMHLAQAHNLARGDHVLVAVIDSKIDASHPELAGTITEEINVLDDKDARPHAHGTAMAGAIVSQSKIMGVAPDARILAIRAFSQTSTGAATGTSYDLARAIDRAVEAKARVINLSFAGPADPMLQKSLDAARQSGAILIAAAGNAGPKSAPLYPAADASVIAVTATDAQDNLYADANRGKYIAVAAPGVDVLVPAPDKSYEMTTGTSVAAAHISGVVALLLGRHPDLAPDAVRAVLTKSAHRPQAGAPDDYGAGIADAYKAIVTLDPQASSAPPSASAKR